MARITGFKCDGLNCATTAETTQVPNGWMTLTIHAHVNGREEKTREELHFCSNKCLKVIATARHKAAMERGDEPKTNYLKYRKEGLTING